MAYEYAAGKKISQENYAILAKLYAQSLAIYRKENSKIITGVESPELGALIVVCNSILNLDEVITKS